MSTSFPVCALCSRVKSLTHPGPKARGQLEVQSATVLCVRGSSWSGERLRVNQSAAALNAWSVPSNRA